MQILNLVLPSSQISFMKGYKNIFVNIALYFVL